MTAYDVRAKAQAARVLNTIAGGGKGQAVTLTRQVTGGYNLANGTDTLTTTTQTGSGVDMDYSSRAIDGDLVKAGDRKLLLSPLNSAGAALTAPVADETTVTLADGSVWTVKRVETLAPAGTVILFTLQLRGAP